jgi:hypothetical protein
MRGLACNGKVARAFSIVVILFTLPILQGCLTYSSYQSARIVERGYPHATVGVSRSAMLDEEDMGANWWTIDGDMRFGIAKRVDGSVRLSVFHNVPEGWGGAQITVDVRGGIIDNYLAAAFPLSINLGDFHFYTLRFQPGFIGTIPFNDQFEITGAARAHIYPRVMELAAVAYNLGFGMTTASGEWTIRPEVGLLQFTEGSSNAAYFQYGIGIEHNFVAGKSEVGEVE